MKHDINYKKRQGYYRVLLLFFLLFDCCCFALTFYLTKKEPIAEEIFVSSGKVTEEKMVIPCGLPVGIYVKTDGLLVLDTQILTCMDGLNYEPAKNIIKSGDYIVSVDGKEMKSKEELQNLIEKSNGEKIEIELIRGKKRITVAVKPVQTSDGTYKLGVWLRDDTQGLGTLTYIDGDRFGALGHGINDYDTGKQMEIEEGCLYQAKILSVKRGESGNPGELVGHVEYEEDKYIGKIEKNSEEGIYGTLKRDAADLTSYPLMPVGNKKSVKKGTAYIRFLLDEHPKDYEIRILKVDESERNKKQGILFEVTDKELLRKTGGVVQGMSGSPVIQDGRIVGAVTHVLVNDPTRGYGIFIENMLEAAK